MNQICACDKHSRSCPAARRFTLGLSTLKHRKRESARVALKHKAPRMLLWILRAAFNDSCEYCGRAATDLTIDRICPGAAGGTYAADNVTLACRRCNSSKCADEFTGPVRSAADMGGIYFVH